MIKQNIGLCIKKIINQSHGILSPILAAFIILFSVCESQYFSGLKSQYSEWSGALTFVEAYHIQGLIMCATLQCFLSIFNHYFIGPTIKGLEINLRLEKERNEIISTNTQGIFDNFLYNVLVGKLNVQGSEARITLYMHDYNNQSFFPFSRYSTNPHFRQHDRIAYSDDTWIFNHGWAYGWCFDADITDQNYVQYHNKKYEVSKQILSKIKMQSKLYAAMRIENKNNQPIALLMIESMDANQLDESSLKALLIQEIPVLSSLITQLKEHIPMPKIAKEKGL